MRFTVPRLANVANFYLDICFCKVKETKEILQNARLAWLSEKIKSLKLEFPIAEISKKTGYPDSSVSVYLSNKRNVPVNFLRKFCEV